jgi:hypothetical protein
MQLVNQFEMVVPSKESYNAFDLKFLRDKANPFTPKRGGGGEPGQENVMRRSGSSAKSFQYLEKDDPFAASSGNRHGGV